MRGVVVAEGGGEVTGCLSTERPQRRPVDNGLRIKFLRDIAVHGMRQIGLVAFGVLSVAEEQALAHVYGGAAKVVESSAGAPLITAVDSRIPLEPFAQSTGPGLHIGRPFSRTHVSQVTPKMPEVSMAACQIMPSQVDVHGRIA